MRKSCLLVFAVLVVVVVFIAGLVPVGFLGKRYARNMQHNNDGDASPYSPSPSYRSSNQNTQGHPVPCLKTYTEALLSFSHPCDWQILHPGIDYGEESELHILKEDQFLGAILVYSRNDTITTTDSKESKGLVRKDLTLLEVMYWNGYNYDLLNQHCVQMTYGELLGYECSMSPYGYESFYFLSKKDGRFIEIAKGDSRYAAEFRQLVSSFQLKQ